MWQVKQSAVLMRRAGDVVIQRNFFHHCRLVWLVQQGAQPRITHNHVSQILVDDYS